MKPMHASGVGSNDSNDDRDVAVLSHSAPPSGSNSTQKDHKKHSSSSSPRRRSNRDVNSIRLNGVGKTAHTFYRRMHTLFFSNPNREEYEALFANGSRRRKRKSKESESSNSTGTCSNPDEHEKDIRMERVTKPEEAPIYVIENFLTEKELEYFDEKITSIRFERSFVDNMGYKNEDENEDEDENDNNNDGVATHNCGPAVSNGVLGGEEKNSRADNSASEAEKQAVSTGDKRSEPGAAKSHAKKTGKKRKKRKPKTMIDDSHRTSTFYSFRKLHDAKISALERRIANILGCWVHQIEALQLVRYVPGQFFGIHHDLGNLLEDDNVQLPPKDWACKRRLVTMFCYLNTLQEDEGGCTYFPKCSHLRVRPKRGRAVLWCNITQDGKPDANTIHAGEAVTMTAKKISASETFSVNQPAAGANHSLDAKCKSKSKIVTTKYGLNIWVCEE